jgi:hypothetical protein
MLLICLLMNSAITLILLIPLSVLFVSNYTVVRIVCIKWQVRISNGELFSTFFALPEYIFMPHDPLDTCAPDILEIDDLITATDQDLETTIDACLWANRHVRN